MKKALALLLSLVMAMSLLTACGGGNNSNNSNSNSNSNSSNSSSSGNNTSTPDASNPEDVSLKVWCPEEEHEIVQQMCAAFDAAHPEYNCTFEVVVVGIDESESQLTNDPELAADVMQLPSGGLSQLNDAGLLLPITANVDEVKTLYGEGALEAVTRHSDALNMDLMYGVPFSPNCFFMYYNKDLYTEDEVKSLETMMAKDLGDDVYNFSFTIHNSWYVESFFYAAGCTLFGADGTDPTDCTWNSANGLAAANYLIDLNNNPKYIEDNDGVAGAMMKDGKLGALCSGNWAYPDLYEVMGDKLGACALPTININGKDSNLANFADYKCWSVKSNTSAPLAAQLLAEWFANAENQLIRYQEAGAAPCALALMDDPEINANVSTTALIAQTQFAIPQPSISQIANYWTPAEAFGTGITQGTITSANAQSELDKCVNQILSEVIPG